MLKAVKLSRKTGIAIAVIGLLCIGGIANSVKNIKFESLKSVVDLSVAPIQEFSGIAFNENALLELGQFEYQFGLGEFYSNDHQYEKALACYSKAILCAKESLGAKSFFTALAYFRKGHVEEEHSKYDEAHDDFKASLEALPNREEYDIPRCTTETFLISTAADKTKKRNIPLYRQHLALTEKIVKIFPNNGQHTYALWILGRGLDDDQQYSESEPIWKRMLGQVRVGNYPSHSFELYLLEFASHEMYAAHYTQSETALTETLKMAAQTGDNDIAVSASEVKGDLYLRQNDLVKGENAYQTCLELRKKLKDKKWLSWDYGCLAEVARRRNDLAKREEYSKKAMQLMEEPTEKAGYLETLVFIAVQQKRAPQVKEYCEQWKHVVKTKPQYQMFIYEEDLKNLLVLYPRLRFPKKVSSIESVSFDLKKLEPQESRPHERGYHLNPRQNARLMDVITSPDQSI